jgi:hypothetical protein
MARCHHRQAVLDGVMDLVLFMRRVGGQDPQQAVEPSCEYASEARMR